MTEHSSKMHFTLQTTALSSILAVVVAAAVELPAAEKAIGHSEVGIAAF
jgi:hypothetical protein